MGVLPTSVVFPIVEDFACNLPGVFTSTGSIKLSVLTGLRIDFRLTGLLMII